MSNTQDDRADRENNRKYRIGIGIALLSKSRIDNQNSGDSN